MDRPAVTLPSTRDVHVWRIELRGSDPDLASLSREERARLERLTGAARARFAASHGAMRQILGSYLGCAPADVPVEARSGEPPRLLGFELSLAHCEGLALLAVALRPVGVDVEAIDHVASEELAELAAATLTRAEARRLRRLPPEARARAWLRSWVRKEAVLKAWRQGLDEHAMTELDVSADRIDDLALVDLDLGPDHLGAAAISEPAVRVIQRDWTMVQV